MKKNDRKLLLRLWRYLLPYNKLVVLAVVILVVSKVVEAYVPVYIGQVTQTILTGNEKMLDPVIWNIFNIFMLVLFAYLLDNFTVLLKNIVGQRAVFTLRSDLYGHIQNLPMDYYNHHKVGTLITRTIHDVDQINLMFAESLVPLVGNIVLFISICFYLLVLDWRVAILLCAILPFASRITWAFSKAQRLSYASIRKAVSKMNAFVQEHLYGAATIRSFGLQKEEKKHFDQLNDEHRKASVETVHHFAKFYANIDLIQSYSLIAVFVFLVLWTPLGESFKAGTYFAFTLYINMLFRPASELADRYNMLQFAVAAAERIFIVLDQPLEPTGGSESAEEIKQLAFEDVWFAYKDEDWVLKGLSFEVRQGESVAFVGMTGAGKTTILNLLLRFYDYQRGKIIINGKEIKDYSIASLRKLFGVVLQDTELFSGTIADNISLYNPAVDEKKLKETISFMGLEPFLAKYSDGMNHQLTEGGKGLSVGESQLIAIARMVANDCSCVILDEATSNIDIRSEKVIQEALKKIFHLKTSLVIAHRLTTIKDVSRIIVLHQGQMKETGSHFDLIKKKGIYEKLYRLQFLEQS